MLIVIQFNRTKVIVQNTEAQLLMGKNKQDNSGASKEGGQGHPRNLLPRLPSSPTPTPPLKKIMFSLNHTFIFFNQIIHLKTQ